ncbi:uncharacterized protein LOC144600945 [Rhinoraja longicauda]
MAQANGASGIAAICLIFFGVICCIGAAPTKEKSVLRNDTLTNKTRSFLNMTSMGNVSSTKNETSNNFSLDVQQNRSATALPFITRKINTSTTSQSSRAGFQSTTVAKTEEMIPTTVNDGANVNQTTGSELPSQSSGPVPLPTTANKPEDEISTVRPTTVNNGGSGAQPTGSELPSQSSGPVPHPTTANKPEEEIIPVRPTTVNNGGSGAQSTGSELPSQTTIVTRLVDDNLPSIVKASVTKPSALNIDKTAKTFLQSDKKVAAKPAVDDGHFIIYLILGSLLVSLAYITYHNKNKIISLCQRAGSRRTRRPKASEYQRLDQNLNDVMTSLKKKINLKMN